MAFDSLMELIWIWWYEDFVSINNQNPHEICETILTSISHVNKVINNCTHELMWKLYKGEFWHESALVGWI